ncbi:hypothetical protein ACIPRL_08045 [Streptomyces sp. NPDC090085]|uniref:protein kinase domain-containing protein n=1 Tax=Streptomyces sp. NPDC090085 TaxID=3365943 RepID=UPI0038000991
MNVSAPVGALAAHLGAPVEARLISDRRGSRAWEVTTADGTRLALKANSAGEGTGGRNKATAVEQEADNLTALTAACAIPRGYLHASGAWESGHWLAARWISGQPLWQALEAARASDGDTPEARRLLMSCAASWARALAALHGAGWAHADAQPTNTLVEPGGTARIIDFAWSSPTGHTPPLPYRGALTHTTAPEVAAALLSTPDAEHIPPTPGADVWGLAASLLWCWTGRHPVAYRSGLGQDDRPGRLRDIADHRLASLADVRPWPFPAFEELLTVCLAADPDARPKASELVAWGEA